MNEKTEKRLRRKEAAQKKAIEMWMREGVKRYAIDLRKMPFKKRIRQCYSIVFPGKKNKAALIASIVSISILSGLGILKVIEMLLILAGI